MYIAIGILILLVALYKGLVIYSYRGMFFPKMTPLDQTKADCLADGSFDEDFLSLPWESATVVDSEGVSLAMIALPAKSPSAGTILLVHGITANRYTMFKFARIFAERDWNVALVDLPLHGASGGSRSAYPAYGFRERHAVAAAAEWAVNRFPGSRPFGLLGESLGAASVLMAAPLLSPRSGTSTGPILDFVIADCPFSSADGELRARLAASHLSGPLGMAISWAVSRVLRALRGYSLEDASPEKAILETEVPILFIHGTEDRYVPTAMSVSMANSRRAAEVGTTELILIPDASHVKSVVVHPDEWIRGAFSFIEANTKNLG